MSNSAKQKGRSKHPLFSCLHQQIITGKYQSGDRLPNRSELEKEFDASSLTVQRALDKLKRDGFVTAKSGSGTYVSDNPPHVCNFGIVLPSTWQTVRFYRLLKSTAEALQAANAHISFSFYDDMDRGQDGKAYPVLCDDIMMHRVAGVFFVTVTPALFSDTPILDEANMPRLVFCSPGDEMGLPRLTSDNPGLYDKVFHYFSSKGRTKVAVICEMNIRERMKKLLPTLLDKYGLAMPPYWLLTPDRETDSTATVVQLLLNAPVENRPDALFCTSDMFYDGLTRGIIASNLKLPEELSIVSHYNFPAVNEKIIPMRRIGYSLEDIINKVITSLQAQREDGLSENPQIFPKFEEEFEKADDTQLNSSLPTALEPVAVSNW